MWIPKWQRDQQKGIDSPVPTQVVSNEEFIPRPQNQQQKQVEYLTSVLAVEMAALATDLKLTIHPHPTLSETLMEASEVFFGQATDVYKPKKRT